ncbi:hypothetical protein JKP88DRAFT_133730, partial [Tribonema minus]
RDNMLTSLSGVSSLRHLQSLNACNNSITSIDDTWDLPGASDSSSLTCLDLSENNLQTLDGLCSPALARLRCLSVRHNELCTLPPTFGDLDVLEELDVSENAITSVAATYKMQHLRVLNCEHN